MSPAFKPTAEQRESVELMISYGAPETEICLLRVDVIPIGDGPIPPEQEDRAERDAKRRTSVRR